MTSKEAIHNLEHLFEGSSIDLSKHFEAIEKDLEVLEQLETLKNYYEPFKQFLKEMFEKGHNEDLTKVKEWLENVK